MTDYPYGYCGMPCALCSRYRTDGKSRCLGCSHDGYYTDVCKIHHCCRDKSLMHCGMCEDYPCARLGKMNDFKDLSTNNVKKRTGTVIRSDGFDKWYDEYSKRADLLTVALENYNDGRMKRYLCELFIQNNIDTLEMIMRKAQALSGTIKEKAKAFREIADAYIIRKEG